MSKEKVKKYFKELPKRYFITAFSGMALGLFCTLIAGTIIGMVAGWIGKGNFFGDFLFAVSTVAKILMGAGIGIGIAYKLEAKPLVIFSEGKRYWHIFEPICEELERRGQRTVYMTESADDPAFEKGYQIEDPNNWDSHVIKQSSDIKGEILTAGFVDLSGF